MAEVDHAALREHARTVNEWAATQPPTPPAPVEPWRCRACGHPRWVSVSLNGGLTRLAQCVMCGHYSDIPEPTTEPTEPETGAHHG